ncbi:hypothetical protein LIER_03425 [Lithospermum erythrorhizon]|uniref:GTD-binding domain-containing protein n=1 Tax=Lithospermum erythrorhizon TaxID=34254 RepID=A0AAV3NTI5_LITER
MSSSKEKIGKFRNLIKYVILEWTMILILFLDGLLSFCSNEIARVFGLKTPCLLCTRFDHALVPRNKNFYYNDSICEEHKKNISSLAYCTTHKKLSDTKNLCEGCLLSFASERNPDYKTLAGIFDNNFGTFGEENNKKPFQNEEKCACCGETLKARPSTNYSRSNSIKPSFISRNNSIKSSFISQSPMASPRGRLRKAESFRNSELFNIGSSNLRFVSTKTPHADEISTGKEENKCIAAPVVQDSEDLNEDRIPMSRRTNSFCGIPLTESPTTTPRWKMSRHLSADDQVELVPKPTDVDAMMNEVDGDHIINRLKREVRLDRRSLIELYMELDEERNASEIAANNAMAMITRLQAEKAAVQMEALQYQRMMEEQAEYDQEEVQVMKDLVLKREEEIDVLESELESYRDKYGAMKTVVGSEICEGDAEEYQEMKSQSLPSSSEKSQPDSPKGSSQMGVNEQRSDDSGEGGVGSQDTLTSDFEGERSYLLGLLKNLEKNVESSSEQQNSSSPDRETEQKSILSREMSTIRERLRALEAESGFLKHAAMTMQKGTEGTKLLSEIAEHLRKLRNC